MNKYKRPTYAVSGVEVPYPPGMKEMTESEINCAIAEACGIPMFGLKKRGYWYRANARGYTDRQSEAGRYTKEEAKLHEYKRGGPDERVTIFPLNPPNYCQDLNAMHEAENVLSARQNRIYATWLTHLCADDFTGGSYGRPTYRATSSLRAEAFLRAIGKWPSNP